MTIGADTTIGPGVSLRGPDDASASGCELGPHTTLHRRPRRRRRDVLHSFVVEAEVGDGATVGPFAYLRPGTVVGAGAKVGTFVEVKNSDIGAGAKVPHLSYIGDADVGEGSQPRRQHHHRQLRRPPQAPDEDRKEREDGHPHLARRTR